LTPATRPAAHRKLDAAPPAAASWASTAAFAQRMLRRGGRGLDGACGVRDFGRCRRSW
jgi:hypothetical protein